MTAVNIRSVLLFKRIYTHLKWEVNFTVIKVITYFWSTFLTPVSTDPCCWEADDSSLSLSLILSPDYLSFSPLPSNLHPLLLPPSHSALASGVPVMMESLVSLCEPMSLMRHLSHTPYQINRLHQPITTTKTQQPGPGQTKRLTSLLWRSHSVIDKMGCKQRQ